MRSWRFSPVTTAFLILLGGLIASRGGRPEWAQALYQAVSIALFIWTFRVSPPPLSTLTAPLISCLIVALACAAMGWVQARTGLGLLGMITAHALNFLTLLAVINKDLARATLMGAAIAGGLLSLHLTVQSFSGGIKTPFFPNANLQGGFIALSALICAARLSFEERGKAWWTGLLALCLAALLFSGSRGAVAAFAAGLMVLAWVAWEKASKWIVLCIAGMIGTSFLFPVKTSTLIIKTFSSGDYARAEIWTTSVEMVMKRPVLGWGLGRFGQAYELHKKPMEQRIARYGSTTDFAHNEFLQISVEAGLVGLAAFLWLCWVLTRMMFITNFESWERLAAAACLTSIAAQGLVDFNWHLPVMAFIALLCVATLTQRPADALPLKSLWWMIKPALILWFTLCLCVLGSDAAQRLGKTELASRLNPFNAELHRDLSRQDSTQREQRLAAAAQTDPENAARHADMARFLFNEGRWPEAEAAYAQALRRSPKNAFYWTEIGDVALRLNRLSDARSLHQRAVSLEPLYAFAHYRLGEIELALNRPQEAKTAFENAEKVLSYRLQPDTEYAARLLDLDPALPRLRLAQWSAKK